MMLNGSDRRTHLRRLERLREGFMKKADAASMFKPLTRTLAVPIGPLAKPFVAESGAGRR
jgi:hypothetical protein